jgi:predicted DNA-binding protein (UPF0251 family)
MPRGYCCRRREGCVGRKPKFVNISAIPLAEALAPEPFERGSPIMINLAELEALRLVEVEKMSCVEAGFAMGVSRNTIWRLIESGKEKLITAFFDAKKITLQKDEQ